MLRRRLSRVAVRSSFADLPRTPRRQSLSILLCGAVLLGLAIAWPARDVRAACLLVGTTETCTGDVSGGANFTNNPHPVTVDTLNANNLTNSIAPPSGTPGLGFSDVGDHGPNG